MQRCLRSWMICPFRWSRLFRVECNLVRVSIYHFLFFIKRKGSKRNLYKEDLGFIRLGRRFDFDLAVIPYRHVRVENWILTLPSAYECVFACLYIWRHYFCRILAGSICHSSIYFVNLYLYVLRNNSFCSGVTLIPWKCILSSKCVRIICRKWHFPIFELYTMDKDACGLKIFLV